VELLGRDLARVRAAWAPEWLEVGGSGRLSVCRAGGCKDRAKRGWSHQVAGE